VKKNWFMTQRDQVIDLNDFNMFGIVFRMENWNVFAEKKSDFLLEIAYFKDKADAKEYLKTIYIQLLNETYKSIDEIMPMEVPKGYIFPC